MVVVPCECGMLKSTRRLMYVELYVGIYAGMYVRIYMGMYVGIFQRPRSAEKRHHIFSRRRICACSAEFEHAASNRDTKFGHVAPDLTCSVEFFATRKCSAESVPALDLPKCSAEPRRRTHIAPHLVAPNLC